MRPHISNNILNELHILPTFPGAPFFQKEYSLLSPLHKCAKSHASKGRFIKGTPGVSVPCLCHFSHRYFSQRAEQQCVAVGSSPVTHGYQTGTLSQGEQELSCFLTSSTEVQVAQTTWVTEFLALPFLLHPQLLSPSLLSPR